MRSSSHRRLVEKIEWHSTPKHGSWLKKAEMEPGVLSCQALAERMDSRKRWKHEVVGWEQE